MEPLFAAFALLVTAVSWFLRADLRFDFDALVQIAVVVSFAAFGALIASNFPRNSIEWMFLVTATLAAAALALGAYGFFALRSVPDGPLYAEALWLASWIWVPALCLAPFGYAVFPTGRLPSRRWSWIVVLTVVTNVLYMIGLAIPAWTLRGPLLLHSRGWLPLIEPTPPLARVALALLTIGLLGGASAMLSRSRPPATPAEVVPLLGRARHCIGQRLVVVRSSGHGRRSDGRGFRAGSNGARHLQVPALRDRPDNQPHDRLHDRHRDVGTGLCRGLDRRR